MPTDPTTPTPDTPPRTTNHNPRTDAQREAARRNGQMSRGPKSPEGKARSARNALKHGMAGAGTFLPDDMARELEAELAVYEKKLQPRDLVETRLVHKAALASLRWTRLAQAELAAGYHRERHAVDRWALGRRRRVRRLIKQLRDPAHADPAGVADALRRDALGCRMLAREHARLAGALAFRGGFTREEALRILRLAGHASGRLRIESTPPEVRLWSCLLPLIADASPEGATGCVAEPLTLDMLDLPEHEMARGRLAAWLERKAARLRHRAVRLRRRDNLDRAQAPLRALADPTPEGARLARYLNDADRTHRRALADLDRLRRPARKEPEPLHDCSVEPPAPPRPARNEPKPVPTDPSRSIEPQPSDARPLSFSSENEPAQPAMHAPFDPDAPWAVAWMGCRPRPNARPRPYPDKPCPCPTNRPTSASPA